ncbi:MAG: DUF1971 domain-containing protein [Erythrobacter sp.]|nr:MAG: DUF1971 domain-containing protein [Erythrobacter sp.]
MTANRFALPEAVTSYRRIGPFTSANLPGGLLREHRLKEGNWGRVEVKSGSIGFVWDDDGADKGGVAVVRARQTIIVPPTVPHHLQSLGEEFELEIEFLSEG